MTRDLLGMSWVEAFLKYKAGSSEGEQEGVSTMPARILKLSLMVEGRERRREGEVEREEREIERETHSTSYLSATIL